MTAAERVFVPTQSELEMNLPPVFGDPADERRHRQERLEIGRAHV